MIKILAIDDNNDNLISLKAIVNDAFPDSTFITALNGSKGIELAIANDPDVILLDIVMPDMDGFEVCRLLKLDERVLDIPVVFLTAIKGDKESRIKALEIGAEGFLYKPIEVTELTAQIRAMVKIRSAKRLNHDEKEHLDKLVNERTRDLGERIKELNCLYGIAKVVEIPGITLESIIEKTVSLLPQAWQYPEITCARITLENEEYKTDNFLETKWKQTADIIVLKKIAGEITICYLEERSKYDKGPFLKEERILIDVIAERLGRITERKQIEIELVNSKEKAEESEEKYKALYENAPLPYLSLNEDGSFKDVNPAWLSTLGYQRNEVIGKFYKNFLHPDWKEHFETNFPAFKECGYVHDLDFKIQHKKGHYIDISFEGCVGYHPDGSFKQTYCVFQDVTERNKAQESKKESQEDLLLSQKIAKLGHWKLNINTMEVKGSPELYEIFEIDGNNLDLNDFSSKLYPDDKDFVLSHIQKSIDIGESYDIEHRLLLGEKKISWIRAIGDTKINELGKVIEVSGIVQVITESKQNEQTIQKNKNRLDYALDVIATGAWELDLIKLDSWRSFNHDKIFGYTKPLTEWTYEMFLEHVVQEDREMVDGKFQQAISTKTDWNFECRINRIDGAIRWILGRGNHELNKNEEATKMFGIVQDITEQKLSEKKSKDSEEKFRSIIEQAGDAVYLSDFEGNILLVNKNACEMLGYSNEELIEMKVRDLDVNFVEPKLQKELWNKLEPNKPQTLETNHKHKNGKIIPVEVRFGLFENEGKKNILGFARDVTERKIAQSMLQESQNNLAAVFNNTQDAQLLSEYTGNENFIIVAANNSYIKKINQFGIKISESDLIGISLKELTNNILNLSNEVFEYTIGFYLKVIETSNQLHHNEHFVIGEKDYYSETSYTPILNSEKGMSYVLYNSHDTSEKRVAEEKVQSQLNELQRWQDVMINREEKTLVLKHEINELLKQIGKPIRYSSVDKESKKNENQDE